MPRSTARAGLTVADIARGGALSTYSAAGYSYAGEQAGWTRGWTWTSFEEGWQYGFPQEIAHFVDCIENGTPPMLTGEDGRDVLEVICAAYLSARTGKRIRPPVRERGLRPYEYWLGAEGAGSRVQGPGCEAAADGVEPQGTRRATEVNGLAVAGSAEAASELENGGREEEERSEESSEPEV